MKGGMYSGCTIRNTRSVNGWIVKTLGLLLITSLLLTGPGVAKASETSTFSDISGHKYEALIEQAAEDGITSVEVGGTTGFGLFYYNGGSYKWFTVRF